MQKSGQVFNFLDEKMFLKIKIVTLLHLFNLGIQFKE